MFRFNIRDLLWLTLVAAVAVCLIRNHQTIEQEGPQFGGRRAMKQYDADLANERRVIRICERWKPRYAALRKQGNH